MNAPRNPKPHFDPPYDRLLEGILSFRDLASTEQTIRNLENLRIRFLASSDKKGMDYCRQVGRLGRRRAEMIARNTRVAPAKRLPKKEAALWFRIWLETPELFEDWLSLRKQSMECKAVQQLEAGT